ncbi:GNAT family N-acetyltransferase [Enterococcus sp. DIV0876]|uniref:GNAT family N-acetyltransferase n=1 Tax=Enterococcus sp. DIV0876 TaxID=2774633 RepID=UPI003D301741
MENKERHRLLLATHQTIDTPRLILRPVTLADAEDMYAYGRDEETTRFVFPRHQSIDDTILGIATYFIADPLGKFAVQDKASGKMIGTIDLRVDSAKENAEIGYTLSRMFWGQGMMPEAAMALLHFGFETLDLVRIYALHDVRNQNSGRVMEKIGMKIEATIPAARKSQGQVVDEVMRGITKEEWTKRVM